MKPSQWLITLGLAKKPAKELTVEVSSAPEPDEILWHNLELTDEHETAVELWGYTLTTFLIMVGVVLLVGVKAAALWYEIARDSTR